MHVHTYFIHTTPTYSFDRVDKSDKTVGADALTHPHSHFIHEISTHNFERLYQSAQRVGAVVLVHQHNTHFTSTTSTSPAQNSHTVLRGWKRVPRQSQQMNRCTHTLILPTHHQQNTHTPPFPTHNTHSTHTTPKYSFKRLE